MYLYIVYYYFFLFLAFSRFHFVSHHLQLSLSSLKTYSVCDSIFLISIHLLCVHFNFVVIEVVRINFVYLTLYYHWNNRKKRRARERKYQKKKITQKSNIVFSSPHSFLLSIVFNCWEWNCFLFHHHQYHHHHRQLQQQHSNHHH